MMNKAHSLSGAVAALAVAPLVTADPVLLAASTGVGAFAALLPDLDHPAAKASRMLGPLRHIVAPLIARVAGGHRAGTHYLITHLAIGAVLWFTVAPWLGLAVGVGMFAHTVGDCCTVGGVRAFWPIPVRVRGPLQTGGIIERAVVTPGLMLVLAWLAWLQVETPARGLLTALGA